MKLIRSLLFFFTALLFCYVAHTQPVEKIEHDFISFDFVQSAILNRNLSLLGAKFYKYFFAPQAYFNIEGNCSGNAADGWDVICATPSVGFSLNLPSMISADFNARTDIMRFEHNSDVLFQFAPSASISVPVVFRNEILKCFNSFARGYYSSKKKEILLEYKTSICNGMENYIFCIGNYLYYKELVELNEKKLALLSQLVNNYERMFAAGKITSIQFEEQLSVYNELFYEQSDCKVQLIYAEKSIYEIGAENTKYTSFKDFIDFWKSFFDKTKDFYGADELEILRIENQQLKNAESAKSSVPYFTCGFTFTSGYFENDFSDFSNSSWNFDISLKIPCFPDLFSADAQKQFFIKNKILELEKNKVKRKQKSSENSRNASILMYENYIDSMEKNVCLEKNRFESYKILRNIGRISDFDLKYQENALEFAGLNKTYAEFKFLVLQAGFY